MRVTMNKKTHRRKTAKESLALGTGRGAERPPREKRSPPVLSRGRKLMRMFQTAKPRGIMNRAMSGTVFGISPALCGACICVRMMPMSAIPMAKQISKTTARTLELVCYNFCTTFLSKKAIGCMNSFLFLVPIMLSVYSF